MKKLILSACLLTTCSLIAEIESVSLQWNNVICRSDCAELMDRELRKVKEVSNVGVSQTNGTATMQWKAQKPFSFPAIDSAIKKVGLHIQVVKVRVRGTISEKNKRFYIHSIGDKSKFNLLGAPENQADKNRYIVQQSRFNRPLSDAQIEILRDAMQNDLIVTIEGPIYQPYQFPPLDIIIQSINVSESTDKEKNY